MKAVVWQPPGQIENASKLGGTSTGATDAPRGH
jgi:hypothetical protein